MPGGYQYIKPPGQRPTAPNPVQSVANFQNQELGGLMTGTGSEVGSQAGSVRPGAGIAPQGQSDVALSAQRTTSAVRDNSRKLLATAQVARQRQQALEAQKSKQQSSGGKGYGTGQRYQNPQGQSGGGGGGGGGGGPAVTRLQGILRSFPGLHITETLGNRDYDVAHGVDRVPNSYHYDRNNPAVDIAGSQQELQKLYKQLLQTGGWRQILWQVPGHYDHIHVAAEGGLAGVSGGLGTAIASNPDEIPSSDTELTALTPGEFVMTKEATERIGPENLAAANDGADLGAAPEGGAGGSPEIGAAPMSPPPPTTFPGIDVTALAGMAYRGLGQNVSQHMRGGSIPGVRTAIRNLRPGDLVAWRDGSHVAVYAGNGEVADTSSPGGRRQLWAPDDAIYGIALRLPGE